MNSGKNIKKLSIFDFDDTLVSTDANVHVTHKNGKTTIYKK